MSRSAGRSHDVGMHTDRPNTKLAATVDQALAMAEDQGLRAAAHFLEARGASFALTCRVLMEPARRRATGIDLVPPSR